MRTPARCLAALAAAALCAACAHHKPDHPGPPPSLSNIIPSLGGASHVYTLTNLHTDDERKVLYTGRTSSSPV